jgi:Down syndrome cell adhesion protein 1
VSQEYATRVNDVDVILGNSALMRCEIPSFVADFVSGLSWSDNQGEEYFNSPTSFGKSISS